MTNWFTADTHWNHVNILRYCNRPFENVERMNEALINNWNERVGDDDTVHHLGDVTLNDHKYARELFSQLNGHIIVLANWWHHDRHWLDNFAAYNMRSKSGYPVLLTDPLISLELPEYSENGYPKTLVMCHFPMARWEKSHYNSWHVHGHCHGMYQGPPRSMDVGVDCAYYSPLSFDEIAQAMLAYD